MGSLSTGEKQADSDQWVIYLNPEYIRLPGKMRASYCMGVVLLYSNIHKQSVADTLTDLLE